MAKKKGGDMTLSPTAKTDVLAALAAGTVPEEFWETHDDKCDCVYQRLGMWTNPYLGETLEVRMCCIWAELYKLFPQFVRVVPAYQDSNRHEWVTETADWNGEFDMPPAIWYRQIAKREGISVAEARARYKDRDDERPKGMLRPVEEQPVFLSSSQMLALEYLGKQAATVRARVGAILQEAGLDPTKVYNVLPSGEVLEVKPAEEA